MTASLLFINPKFSSNVGTMARNAELFGFDKLYVSQPERTGGHIGATDTAKSFRRIGEFVWDEIGLISSMRDSGHKIIAIELENDATDVTTFDHPEDALYIIGSEDKGISRDILDIVDETIVIPAYKQWSFNAADSATIIMYDRYAKSHLLSSFMG